MSYQYLSEDDTSFTIQHPDGNPFKIAKEGLSKSIISKIAGMRPQNMAEGGEVGSPEIQVEPVDNNTYGPSPAQNYGPDPIQAPAPESTPLSIEAMGSNKPSLSTPTPEPTPDNPNNGLSAQFQQIQKNQETAVNAGTKGQIEAQANIAAAQQKQAEAAQNLTDVYTKKYADNDQEHATLMKAYGEGKIDPNRVWNSMSTGSKALAGISLVLGGIGSALAGGPNLAQHTLDRLQDRDIESQKANLGKTANLLTMNMQKFNNLHQAELATRLEQNAALQAKIGQYVANSNSAQVQQNGGLLLSNLQTQGLEMKKNLAMAQAVASLSGNQGSQQQVNPEFLPKEVKERLVNVIQPDGSTKQTLAPDAKSAEDFKKSQVETQSMKNKIDEALRFMDTKGRSPGVLGVFDTEDSAKSDAIEASLLSSVGKLHDLNRLSDADLKLFHGLVKAPGSMNQTSARAKLEYLKQLVDEKVNAADATFLNNYNPGGIKQVAPNLKR